MPKKKEGGSRENYPVRGREKGERTNKGRRKRNSLAGIVRSTLSKSENQRESLKTRRGRDEGIREGEP